MEDKIPAKLHRSSTKQPITISKRTINNRHEQNNHVKTAKISMEQVIPDGAYLR